MISNSTRAAMVSAFLAGKSCKALATFHCVTQASVEATIRAGFLSIIRLVPPGTARPGVAVITNAMIETPINP